MTRENLNYLTSELALADLAQFVRQINKEKGWKQPKWITYGGSYPVEKKFFVFKHFHFHFLGFSFRLVPSNISGYNVRGNRQ